MIGAGVLDALPIWVSYAVVTALALVAAEIGYWLGRRWRRRHPDEHPELSGAMAGAALALLAFYLAFMVSFTMERFDGRRALVMDEANAIGTTYLRAGYLAEPAKSTVRQILREYTDQRLAIPDGARRDEALRRSQELMGDLWAQAEALAISDPNSETIALFIETVNDTIDLGSKRQVAVASWRVPWTMWVVTLFVAFASMALLGFSGGVRETRHTIALVMLVLVFAAVVNLVIDLDRPYEGLLQVSQEALVELQAQIGSP